MLRHRIKRVLSQDTRSSQRIPNRQLCEGLALLLQTEVFSQLHPRVRMQVSLRVLYENAPTYTKKLKEINAFLKQKKPLPADLVAASVLQRSMDLFFTNEQKTYQPLDTSYGEFRAQILSLCELMKESDTSQVGIAEHNLRMLTHVFLNLEELLKTLADNL